MVLLSIILLAPHAKIVAVPTRVGEANLRWLEDRRWSRGLALLRAYFQLRGVRLAKALLVFSRSKSNPKTGSW